jgi:hypothetical protein
MSELKWCYSTNSETFQGEFDSREEAMDAADGGATELGRCKPLDLEALARRIFSASDLDDLIHTQLSDLVGDCAEDAISFQDFQELEGSILPIATAFLEKHLKGFCEVIETESVIVLTPAQAFRAAQRPGQGSEAGGGAG